MTDNRYRVVYIVSIVVFVIILTSVVLYIPATYAQSKFSFPAPISKCSLAMPISIFVYPTIEKPRFAITLGLTPEPCSLGNRVKENFC